MRHLNLRPITGGAAASIFYGTADPGAVGAGAIWLRDDLENGVLSTFVRSADDDGWALSGLNVYDGAGALRASVYLSTNAINVSTTDADGNLRAKVLIGDTVVIEARVPGTLAASTSVIGPTAIALNVTDAAGAPVVAVTLDAASALIRMTGLPASDPVIPDALWLDEGTVKVSAG